MDVIADDVRAETLISARTKAQHLFAALDERGLIAAGMRESAVSDAVRDLATDLFDDVDAHPSRRVVRAGPNTLAPRTARPPDRVIGDDDIVFCDVAPLFGHWEVDFGRTFVVGNDPVKQRLRDALPVLCDVTRRFYRTHPDVTGAQLHALVNGLAAQAGWECAGPSVGHLVGEANEPPKNDVGTAVSGMAEAYIAPGSNRPMRRRDRSGQRCHWALEIHLVDRRRQIAGCHEELLDL